MIFKANCVGPPEYIETKWPIIRERHKSSLQAILDSCIPNEMTGVILKIEHRDMIQGVSKWSSVSLFPVIAVSKNDKALA